MLTTKLRVLTCVLPILTKSPSLGRRLNHTIVPTHMYIIRTLGEYVVAPLSRYNRDS